MKTSFAPIVLILASGMSFGTARAADLDLTKFVSQGNATLTPNLATLKTDIMAKKASISGSVTKLTSFEYRVSYSGSGVGIVDLTLSGQPVRIMTYYESDFDSGWTKYDFKNPYTGPFTLLEETAHSEKDVVFSVRNVKVAD